MVTGMALKDGVFGWLSQPSSGLPKHAVQVGKDSLGIGQPALPYGDDAPPIATQEAGIPAISANVTVELRQPELGIRAGRCCPLTPFMAMPKTPVNEKGNSSREDDEVGATWQTGYVPAKPLTELPEHAGNDFFRPGLRSTHL